LEIEAHIGKRIDAMAAVADDEAARHEKKIQDVEAEQLRLVQAATSRKQNSSPEPHAAVFAAKGSKELKLAALLRECPLGSVPALFQ
jgi:hypothetical protein